MVIVDCSGADPRAGSSSILEVVALTTTTPETATGVLVPVVDPLFSVGEWQVLPGFLSGYRGLTRDAYTLDLRQYTGWCTLHGLHLFTAKRVDIESFRGDMEAAGRAPATIARRLCTIAGFYRYAVEEELLDHSPAAHVRRPRLDYEFHATALDRNQLGALLVAAGLGTAQEHGLISLLALNGLRISEALGADITAMGRERGHRTLTHPHPGRPRAHKHGAVCDAKASCASPAGSRRYGRFLQTRPRQTSTAFQ